MDGEDDRVGADAWSRVIPIATLATSLVAAGLGILGVSLANANANKLQYLAGQANAASATEDLRVAKYGAFTSSLESQVLLYDDLFFAIQGYSYPLDDETWDEVGSLLLAIRASIPIVFSADDDVFLLTPNDSSVAQEIVMEWSRELENDYWLVQGAFLHRDDQQLQALAPDVQNHANRMSSATYCWVEAIAKEMRLYERGNRGSNQPPSVEGTTPPQDDCPADSPPTS